MRFQTQLVPARLTRRYKRFLAECTLEATGRTVTAHCSNPGSMMGLAEPGTRIWLEPNDDPKRKLKFGWRLVDHGDGHFTGVDTSLPNKVLKSALTERQLPAFAGYDTVRAEVAYAQNSRVDFLLSGPNVADAYIEVKSVTLSRHLGLAEFPDSRTVRGVKHLEALAEMAESGHRAVMLYLVQRTDCAEFALAGDIDPAYLAASRAAERAGVEIFCIGTNISPGGVEIATSLALRM